MPNGIFKGVCIACKGELEINLATIAGGAIIVSAFARSNCNADYSDSFEVRPERLPAGVHAQAPRRRKGKKVN